jgi:hypothetical protein
MADVGPIFERALTELGLGVLEKQQALRVLARHYAHAIVSGAVEPYEGARLIWHEISHAYEPFDDVSAFIGLASQIEDYEQMALSQPQPYLGYIEACTRDIRVAAQDYLTETSGSAGHGDPA